MDVRNNKINQDVVLRDSLKFASMLQAYPLEIQVGIGIILPNLINGCSWGFVNNTNDEFLKCLPAINNNPNISAMKVRGGYLVNINMDYLLNILGKTAGGYITKSELEIASRHRQAALVDLEKYMAKGGTGVIGIYNLNDSSRVVVDGKSYRAFCVTLPDLLAICVRNRYGLFLDGKVRTPGQVSRHIYQVVERLAVAPSNNALLVSIVKL